MTTKRWCTKCGTDPAWWLWRSGEHVGCGGRVIPIATICNPPEPTTIDESDLAPGMVGVVTGDTGLTYIVTMDVRLERTGFVTSSNGCAPCVSEDTIRRVAGPRRPC